ncbi:hypothetical protein KSS87_020353 [Heliosperma pusillum]|nr:hypothetical protein KSS87_020353 [Heliosperma pusillum]
MKTPTSSQYRILDNKPIDQLKVTELKEELRKRRLKTGGLKDELIRRLDDALRSEMEQTHVDADGGNGIVMAEAEPDNVVADSRDVLTEPQQSVAGNDGDNGNVAVDEARGDIGVVASENVEEGVGNALEDVDVKGNDLCVGNADANVVPLEVAVKGKDSFEEPHSGLSNDPGFGEEIVATKDVTSVVVGDEVSEEQQLGLGDEPVSREGMVTEIDVGSVVEGDKVIEGFSSEKAVGSDGLIDSKIEKDIGESGEQEHPEEVTPAHEDMKLDSSDQTTQVSEVSTSLGFPVKSNNSVSTDSLSIIEKNDLKDNLNDDNLKLESDVTPEMVQPSSSNLVPDGGESHPRDVDEPHENKVSVEETDNTVANAEMSQKNYSADLGSSEKLNLDRSSGDDSMEEDALESKQIHTNNIEDVGKSTEKNEATTVKAESPVAIAMDTDLPAEKKVIHDKKNDVATLSDKRKFPDEEAIVNNKPAKRQHRWKKESTTVTESQVSHLPPPASVPDVSQPAAFRRSLSRSDSMVTNDPPKEREVPPSTKPATNSLRIDHFLRPFTLKAAQELLGKTGTVTSFWMDQIKTHCYVTYSSIEEAVETRNAVYNLQWPPNGGRQLVAEFVDPGEVKSRLEPPPLAPAPPAPVNSAPAKGLQVATAPQPSPRLQNLRQQPTLPPPPPVSNQAPVRERVPPPPPLVEKVEAPIVTLDDLFRKTKATPRIYYLPLSDEQVAARRRNPKQ